MRASLLTTLLLLARFIASAQTLSTPITGSLHTCGTGTTTLGDATTGGTWSSSNTAVATIGTTGIVTGVAAGTSTITYRLSGICFSVVTLTGDPPPPFIMGAGSVCTGSAITLSDALYGGTWASSNPAVGTIG